MRAAAAHLARPRAPAALLRPAAPARPLTLCRSGWAPLQVAPLGAALLGQRPGPHSGVGAGAAGWVQRRSLSEDSEEVPVAAEIGWNSEGEVGSIWFTVGDTVNADDVLADIEMDKTMVEVRPRVRPPTRGPVLLHRHPLPPPALRGG